MQNRSTWFNFLALSLPVVLATWFYAPVIFDGKIQIHGEGISHGIPLVQILSNSLQGEDTALWTEIMYGGHPIFAEGQGAYAHPLNLLVSWLFPAVKAYNLLPWLGTMITGLGVFVLCRSRGCSRGASLFAVVALIFSTLFIGGRSNLSVGGSLTWIPWAIWAMLAWLQRPDWRSASVFALVMCLMILAGYPHIVHGAVIYLFAYLLTSLCFRPTRDQWLSTMWPRLGSGLFAVLLCTGLSAVQWLPLFELVGESHRSEGISISAIAMGPGEFFYRGLLYTFNEPESAIYPVDRSTLAHFPVMGSLLVCVVASFIAFAPRRQNTVAHLVATLFLLMLGLGVATPVFRAIYEYHLLPGLHNFRIMFPYLFVAATGISVVCACSLDALAKEKPAGQEKQDRRIPRAVLLTALSLAAAWAAIIYRLHTADVYWLQYILAGCWLAGITLLIIVHRRALIPMVSLALLCLEVISLRINSFDFGEPALLEKPQTIVRLEQDPDLHLYKVADYTTATLYSMRSPKDPGVERGLRHMLASMSSSSTALWDISNIRGNTALPLKRQALAESGMRAELNGKSTATPGLRLIDFLGLKYISSSPLRSEAGFSDYYRDAETNALIIENSFARPKFQWFDTVQLAGSAEEALEAVSSLTEQVLVIESDDDQGVLSGSWPASANEPGINVITDRAGRYRFIIESQQGGWLFIADAMYPGWKAYLDGEPTQLYAAQVLGKAVFVPAGTHELKVAFKPASFKIGLYITVFSLLVLLLIFAFSRSAKQHTRPEHE